MTTCLRGRTLTGCWDDKQQTDRWVRGWRAGHTHDEEFLLIIRSACCVYNVCCKVYFMKIFTIKYWRKTWNHRKPQTFKKNRSSTQTLSIYVHPASSCFMSSNTECFLTGMWYHCTGGTVLPPSVSIPHLTWSLLDTSDMRLGTTSRKNNLWHGKSNHFENCFCGLHFSKLRVYHRICLPRGLILNLKRSQKQNTTCHFHFCQKTRVLFQKV